MNKGTSNYYMVLGIWIRYRWVECTLTGNYYRVFTKRTRKPERGVIFFIKISSEIKEKIAECSFPAEKFAAKHRRVIKKIKLQNVTEYFSFKKSVLQNNAKCFSLKKSILQNVAEYFSSKKNALQIVAEYFSYEKSTLQCFFIGFLTKLQGLQRLLCRIENAQG